MRSVIRVKLLVCLSIWSATSAGGALYLATGVLAALLQAKASGRGQVVDASMVEGAASLMGMVYTLHNHGLWRDERGANLLDGGCPYGSTYETADGKYVVVCALEPRFYAALLQGLGLDADSLPDRNDRTSWPALRARFAAAFRSKTREEWTQLLEGTDACVTPVLTLSGSARASAQSRPAVYSSATKPVPAAAPRFSVTPSSHAPMQGPPCERAARGLGTGAGGSRRAVQRFPGVAAGDAIMT